MAVDPSNIPSSGSGGGISKWINANPTLALGGVLIIVLLVGATLLKGKTTTTSTINPSGTAQDLSGLTTNSSGQAVAYVPTTTSFDTYNATNTGTQVTSSGTGGVVVTPTPVVVVPPVATIPIGVRNPPVISPPKISMQWSEGYVSHNQSLNLIASNDTTDMNNKAARDFSGTGILPQRFSVTGQQIYNQNKGTVDAYFSAHNIKGDKLATGTSGLSLVIPTIVLG